MVLQTDYIGRQLYKEVENRAVGGNLEVAMRERESANMSSLENRGFSTMLHTNISST